MVNNDRYNRYSTRVIERVVGFLLNFSDKPKSTQLLIALLYTVCVIPPFCLIYIPYGLMVLYVYLKTLSYFRTPEFAKIKARLAKQIDEYNDFDRYMGETRNYIFQRQSELTRNNVRRGTITVYNNSRNDPYGYIVKYFFNDKRINEASLQILEDISQKYSTIQKTYSILTDEYNDLMKIIAKHMYAGAYIFKGTTMRQLGSRKLPNFKRDYYISYAFTYTSAANRNQYSNIIVLDDNRIQDFAEYLSAKIRYRKSAKYQRQLMTPTLREHILQRDNYTCKKCGVSKQSEKHLLLEVDHIVPVSKGGITTETNLQALCWRCNRTKGAKLA